MASNEELFSRAQASIPGGVNSPVRAFRGVGGTPRFIERAAGPYMWDAEGRRYIDYIGSWGPMILGHGHPAAVAAVERALSRGLSFGAATEAEIELAEEVISLLPSIEQLRLVSSGTEAGMSAIRLARGYTGRDLVIKFEGCYHGHSDSLLVKAGSGLLTFGHPSSAGVPAGCTADTLVCRYNDCQELSDVFRERGDCVAAIIIEAIAGNMNMVPAEPEFLRLCRELCDRHGALLIIDEVMTGFRVALGGAQALYGVRPDITMLGKVIGGGLPVAAFGASREIMSRVAPLGPVYQAGTLSGNPLAVACGLATLREVRKLGFFDSLSATTRALCDGLSEAARAAGVPFSARCQGGMMGLFMLPEAPRDFAGVGRADPAVFARFFHAMLSRGVYLAPSIYEAGFVSAAHQAEQIEATVAAAREAFAELARA